MIDFTPIHEYLFKTLYYIDHDDIWTNSVKRSDDYAPYKISKYRNL